MNFSLPASLPFLHGPESELASQPALSDDSGQWLNHGTLTDKIFTLRQALKTDKKGLILCLAPMAMHGTLAYLVAAASGHAVMPLDPATANLDALLTAYRPEWVMIPKDKNFEAKDYCTCDWLLPEMTLWQRTQQQDSDINDGLFLLLLTSGSTGGKKSVRLSYKNIANNTAAIIQSQNLTATTRAILHLPMTYSFGLSVLHSVLAVGGSVVMTNISVTNRAFWANAGAQQATLFPGVPYHYEILSRFGIESLNAPSLKTFLQAGGHLATPLAEKILPQITARNGEFYIMYGQTEAAPRMACLPLHERPDKIGTVGQALTGGKFSLDDGEIIYHGPNVMMGYAVKREDLARDDTQNGTLATGDIGQLDEEGFLTITGRQTRFAKILGHRIALDELESIVTTFSPAIAFVRGDSLIVMTTAQDQSLLTAIKNALIAKTTLPSACFTMQPVESLLYLPNGKPDYRRMEAMLP